MKETMKNCISPVAVNVGTAVMSMLLLLSGANAGADTQIQARAVSNDLRLDELYYIQPHNSYDHSRRLTNWLDAGYRSLEIDVVDKGDWQDSIDGPYATHKTPGDHNCTGDIDTLGSCLDDVMRWQNANPGEVPLTLFIDMKSSGIGIDKWTASEIEILDRFIADRLGSRLFAWSDLRNHIASEPGTTPRAQLRTKGWPIVDNLTDRIIVAFTGGSVGSVNQRFDKAARNLGADRNAFFCPVVPADAAEEISGNVHGMSSTSSSGIFCANVKAGDHYHLTANRSAEYRQLIHLYGTSDGDFIDFTSTSFEAAYIAVAHGISAMGLYVTNSLNDDDAFIPSWSNAIPPVGKRRSLAGYFSLRTASSSGMRCVGSQPRRFKNGSDITQQRCHFGNNQRFVYTAEGQLRPAGDNRYCVDIESGQARPGKKLHLWNCDGGRSEKWAITPDGQFINFDAGKSYRATVPYGLATEGIRLDLQSETSNDSQKFEVSPVADWGQTRF